MEFSEQIETVDFCDVENVQDITECGAIKRIAVVLACYKDWCENINDDKDDDDDDKDECDGFYSFMYTALNYSKDDHSVFIKLLNDYNHILIYHNSHESFAILHHFYIEHVYDGDQCSYGGCNMLRRNNRDRSAIAKHEEQRFRLYHSYEDSKEICMQQTVDRIHCHYFHCYDLGYKLTKKERQSVESIKIEDEDEDDTKEEEVKNEDDALLNTIRLRKVCSILKEKRKRDIRSRNGRNDTNKFTTIIKEDIEDKKEDKKEDKMEDKKEDKHSDKIKVELRQGLKEREGPDADEYSLSYRYYYWKAYLETGANDEDINLNKKASIYTLKGAQDSDRFEIEPGNKGYKTWDWYIPKRWSDLKTEVTQNTICTIGIEQFEDCMIKAEGYLESDEIGKKLKSYGEWIYKYGISDDEAIHLEHIIALLLYCNYDMLQAQFSSTFRRLEGENDESMKKRHKQFANWARILREAVELYGDNIRGQYTDANGEIRINQTIKRLKFYHGVNCELLFARTIARFNGPMSTTTAIAVAMAFSNATGLCLQLIRKDPEYKHSSFFNCVPISDFAYEEERFFIGGLEPLQIATIIHTKTNTNWRTYVKALNNLQNFIEGMYDGWALHKVTKRMKQQLSTMFECYDDRNYDEKKKKIPVYILNLFRAYANSVTKIDLNLEAINSEKSLQGKFGFKLIRNLIMIEMNDDANKNIDNPNNRQWVKMDTLGNLFRKVCELHVRSGHSINMIKLNEELMADLVGFIQSNNVIERFQQLKKIQIYHPEQSEMKLAKAIKQYKKECLKYGWILDCNHKLRILTLERNKEKQASDTVKDTNTSFMSGIMKKLSSK